LVVQISRAESAMAERIPWANTEERWGRVHQLLHWTIAALILFQLVVGFFFMEFKDNKPPPMLPVHVQVGVLIALLMTVRVVWRVLNPVPPLPPTLNRAQRALARFSHAGLYMLVLLQVCVGYLLEDTFGARVGLFGVNLPSLFGEKQNVPNVFGKIHLWVAWGIVGLLVLHVTGALFHELVARDNVLRRMTPLRFRETR
jgi:cytochrome b561